MTTQTGCSNGSQSVVLGHGFHGIVERDLESGLVCKRVLLSDPTQAASFAHREFDHLQRLSSALSNHEFVSCPAPACLDRENATLWMSFTDGERVDRYLARPDDIRADLGHIARQIAIAIEAYIEEFDEPLYSLATHNMIYDADSGVLSLYDFTMPREVEGVNPARYPYEVTLGCFLAASTRYTVRIRGCTKREYWNRQRQLSIGVMHELSAASNLEQSVIDKVNSSMYFTLGKKDRRLSRRFWYSTVGLLLFNSRTAAIYGSCDLGSDGS